MRSLVTLMVAGFMAVFLTGCGQEAPKQPDVKTETTVVVPASEKSADAPAAAEKSADAPAATQE